MDGTGPIHQVSCQSGGEDGSNGINTDRDPSVQVVQGARGACDFVDATQRLLSKGILGRVSTDGDCGYGSGYNIPLGKLEARADTSDGSPKMGQDRRTGVTCLTLDGQLSLHVNLPKQSSNHECDNTG